MFQHIQRQSSKAHWTRLCLTILLLCHLPFANSNADDLQKTIEDFYSIAEQELSIGNEIPRTLKFVDGLSKEEQIEVAKIARSHSSNHIKRVAASILLKNQQVDDAIPVLADLITSNADLKAIGWSLTHGADENLSITIFSKLARHLLEDLRSLPPEKAKKAHEFLCELAGKANTKCSTEVIEQRIQQIEQLANSIKEESP